MTDTTGPVRVLHVGDDPAVAETTAERLERDRFEVATETTASEAMARLADEELDCVVSDYDISGRDGVEFLERVRESYPDLPFVPFTDDGGEEVASDAIAAGVTDYLRREPGSDRYALLADRIAHAVSQCRGRRGAVETERQLRELSAITNDILWMFSSDWDELLFINAAYEDVWGRSTDRLAGHPTDFLHGVHPDDRERVRGAMEQLSAGGSVDLEFRANADEDFRRWVWVQGQPITDEDGTVARVAGFVRDITERKERERELERQNERLDEFTSVVSHDLFALAREGGHAGEVDTVTLAEATEEAWQYTRTEDATLVVETDRTIRADESRLHQLLGNLLRNAVEHGGTDVTITVGGLDETSGFYVADDGPGIPETDRDRVFEAGYTTEEDGTGFGLSIVAEVVGAHDWEIDVTEGEGGGTRFEITGVEFA